MRSVVIKGALWMANHLMELEEYKVTVDATCGNGNDTLKLAKRSEKVYACDIQEEAIQRTKEKTMGCHNIHFLHMSHAHLPAQIQEEIDLVVFNCGYLPGSDKCIMTEKSSLIQALDGFIPRLSPQGRILIVSYPGTKEGFQEDLALEIYVSHLGQDSVDVFTFCHINGRNMPAKLYIIQKNAR